MLSDKELQVLNIIKHYIRKKHHSPTYAEIATEMGLANRNAVVRYINALKEKDAIFIPEGKRKSIQLMEDIKNTLPLVGNIAAGKPIEAFDVLEQISLDSLINAPDRYLLQVKGDSMQDSGILDGDLVLIQKQHIASPGQIVVAMIDEQEATLKEFATSKNNEVILIPHNIHMCPMTYPAHRVSIQGLYLGARFDKTYLQNH